MQIIKLNATDSTNRYLKSLMNEETLEDYTVVVAKNQQSGRGQLGTVWESDPGKNLTFSVLKKTHALNIPNLFMLNICVSLAVYRALMRFGVPDIMIKWPNDILSGSSKICGILIENILAGNRINSSIIGIGLNVNQMAFNNLPKVSSLKLLLGRNIDLDSMLGEILNELKEVFKQYEQEGINKLEQLYTQLLFRKDKPSTFKNKDGDMFMGFIRGVSKEGKLIVALEDDVLKEFNLKELNLLY